MSAVRWAAIAVALAVTGHAQVVVPSPTPMQLQRSISSSRQFIVYYQDKTVRARLVRKLEDIKTHWLKRLSLKDDWKAPIIVRLQTLRPSNFPRLATGVYESDSGELKIQIDIYEPSALQSADFDCEVYAALCLELAYRNTPLKAGKSFTKPPSWLVEGMYEDGQSGDEGLPPGLYETVMQRELSLKLDAFLKERPAMLDATSRAVFRAQAMGLLRAFLALPKGAASLVEYIGSLPTINATDSTPLLAVFPTLREDPKQLSKLWVLSMADISAQSRVNALSMVETQRQLALILDVSPPKDPKKPNQKIERGPGAITAVARSEEGPYVLKQKADDLLRLEVRAHPLLRPMVAEYREIITQLARKPKKNFSTRLAQNGELVAAITERSDQVSDYMNWYEATELQTPSGNFTEAIIGAMSNPPPRADAISRYLSDIENRGW